MSGPIRIPGPANEVRKAERFAADLIKEHIDDEGVFAAEGFYELTGSMLQAAITRAYLVGAGFDKGPGIRDIVRRLTLNAATVMHLLQRDGEPAVPRLIVSDDNAGERLRKAVADATRAKLDKAVPTW